MKKAGRVVNTKMVGCWMEPRMHAQLVSLAAQRDRSISWIVRKQLELFLDKNKVKPGRVVTTRKTKKKGTQ